MLSMFSGKYVLWNSAENLFSNQVTGFFNFEKKNKNKNWFLNNLDAIWKSWSRIYSDMKIVKIVCVDASTYKKLLDESATFGYIISNSNID